jgi:hypothetical protein
VEIESNVLGAKKAWVQDLTTSARNWLFNLGIVAWLPSFSENKLSLSLNVFLFCDSLLIEFSKMLM